MRVVSLVPSLTETLLVAGVEVVGRTRYCVHPGPLAKEIPIVGGTKDLSWDKLVALGADLLVLDQEENLPWMLEQSPIPVHVFHATEIAVMPGELRRLSNDFAGPSREALNRMADRWEKVVAAPVKAWDWTHLPGELKREGLARPWDQVLYLIWKKPWMSVAKDTFIASVFEKLGAGSYWPPFAQKYPEVDLADFSPDKTLLLLSSEPYPFGNKWEAEKELPFTKVLVDGESFSWFGLRTLQFLEVELGLGPP